MMELVVRGAEQQLVKRLREHNPEVRVLQGSDDAYRDQYQGVRSEDQVGRSCAAEHEEKQAGRDAVRDRQDVVGDDRIDG